MAHYHNGKYTGSVLRLLWTTLAASLPCSSEDVGEPIETVLEPGLQLMHQHLSLGGRNLTLVVPRDVDAVLDMYISRGDFNRHRMFPLYQQLYIL